MGYGPVLLPARTLPQVLRQTEKLPLVAQRRKAIYAARTVNARARIGRRNAYHCVFNRTERTVASRSGLRLAALLELRGGCAACGCRREQVSTLGAGRQ